MNDGRGPESVSLSTDGAAEIAAGFSRDSQRFGESVAPLRAGLTSEQDGRTAWASATLVGADDFLNSHSTVKQAADTLLGILAKDIDGMGRGAQGAIDGLSGQDVHNARQVDRDGRLPDETDGA